MKGNTLVNKSFATIALLILLVSLLPIVPLAVTPVKAGTYLTVSSTNLGEENVLVVTVDDSSIDPDVGPTVYMDIGGTQKIINMSRTVIQSKWIAYIANGTAYTKVGGAKADGTSGYADNVAYNTTENKVNIPANPAAIFFSQGNVSNKAYENVWPVVQLFNITAGLETVTITYYEQSESVTLTHGDTYVDVVSVDRAGAPPEVPPNATIRIIISDETENLDPTASDDSSAYDFDFYVNGQDKTGDISTLYPNLNGTETDKNTGAFEVLFNLTKVNDELPEQLENGDILEIVFKDDDDPDETVSLELKVVETDGVVSVPSDKIYYSDGEFTVTVTDADMNLNTEAKEYVDLNGTVSDETETIGFFMTLTETGEDTGVFEGTIYVNLNSSLGHTANGSDTLTVTVPPGSSASFTLTYNNTFYAMYKISEVTIRLTEPDANDDPDRIDILTINASEPDCYPDVNYTKGDLMVPIGNLSLQVNGGDVDLSSWNGMFLRETGKNTGVFELTVDLTSFVEIGDTVTITYYDAFDDANVTATATIGGVEGSLSLDRTTVPVAVDEDVVVYVTLEDEDWNTSPYIKDEVPVNVTAYNAEGKQVGFWDSSWYFNNLTMTLKETDVNTSIFTGSFTYKVSEDLVTAKIGGHDLTLNNTDGSAVKGQYMVNGKFTIVYEDPLVEDTITASAVLKARSAELNVNVTQVGLKGAILVTVTEPDMDLDSEVEDTVEVDPSRR